MGKPPGRSAQERPPGASSIARAHGGRRRSTAQGAEGAVAAAGTASLRRSRRSYRPGTRRARCWTQHRPPRNGRGQLSIGVGQDELGEQSLAVGALQHARSDGHRRPPRGRHRSAAGRPARSHRTRADPPRSSRAPPRPAARASAGREAVHPRPRSAGRTRGEAVYDAAARSWVGVVWSRRCAASWSAWTSRAGSPPTGWLIQSAAMVLCSGRSGTSN